MFFSRLAFVLALTIIACCMTSSQVFAKSKAPLELTTANIASIIDPVMLNWCKKHKGPGAVVVVVKRDGPVFARGYGYADIQLKKPFTADSTVVRPGSISKLFTGIAVMQLVESGKVDLDSDVNKYLDFSIPTPPGGVPVTLRRLLRHCAGFEEHFKGTFTRARAPNPLGPWLARSLPYRLFPRGDVQAYSNYGVALAGYIVERVSGEPYAAYVRRHILEPLGMNHSTFEQPLPENLSPLMAKGYHKSDAPPLEFFDTVNETPAGGLSATGTDMGRFMRALLNGGELDGARILSTRRLEEMMAPCEATPAGYLGLVFFGTKIGGLDAIGHDGGMLAFMSNLQLFRQQGVGVFVSLDGIGDVKGTKEFPDPVHETVEHILALKAEDLPTTSAPSACEPRLAGIYFPSRRVESTIGKVDDFLMEMVITINSNGVAVAKPALQPFHKGVTFTHVGPCLYAGPGDLLFFLQGTDDGNLRIITPGLLLQRVPWYLDVRFIAPAVAISLIIAILTLLYWPVGIFLARRRKTPCQDVTQKRLYMTSRLIMLVDSVVTVSVAMMIALLLSDKLDFTFFDDPTDPLFLILYALAWLGAFGALPAVWVAVQLWRNRVGSRWSRIHHALLAASAIVLAWFFITFHIAGTTLSY